MKRWRLSAMLAAILLALGFAAMLALNLPGQMSYDSVSQLLDGRTGIYNSWHPAVMAWLLGLFDALHPGTGLYVVFEAGLLALAFGLSLRRDADWGAVLIALGIVLTPQFLLFQGTVWKDVLFADAFVLAFASLAAAVRMRRPLLLIAFFPALVLAALARQNGLVLLPVAALTLGWATARGDARRGLRRAAAAFMLLVALTAGATALLAQRGDHGEGLAGEVQLAQIYDLTGAVKQGYRLVHLPQSDPALAQAIQTRMAGAYSLQMQDTLEPFLPARITRGAVMAEWRTLLMTRPGIYLHGRQALFWQVFATPEIALCHPAYAGIAGDPADLKALGLTARIRPQDIKLASYARGFIGTPVLSHPAFALLAAALLAFYLYRHRPSDIAMAGMLAGALLFAASFFFVSVACDYRYLYPLDLAAMLALFHIFAVPTRR